MITIEPSLPHLKRAQRREIFTYTFVGALTLLLVLSAAIFYRYCLPQPQWVELDNVMRFATTQPTHVRISGIDLWVVNTGGSFTVLNAIPNDRTQCALDWEVARQKLVDPCLGIQYTLAGVYAFEGPPPARSLDQYPTRVDSDNNLLIEITEPLLGLTMEQIKEACAAQQQKGSNVYLTWNWQAGCHVERIGRAS